MTRKGSIARCFGVRKGPRLFMDTRLNHLEALDIELQRVVLVHHY